MMAVYKKKIHLCFEQKILTELGNNIFNRLKLFTAQSEK